jgi:hypothetical protein
VTAVAEVGLRAITGTKSPRRLAACIAVRWQRAAGVSGTGDGSRRTSDAPCGSVRTRDALSGRMICQPWRRAALLSDFHALNALNASSNCLAVGIPLSECSALEISLIVSDDMWPFTRIASS